MSNDGNVNRFFRSVCMYSRRSQIELIFEDDSKCPSEVEQRKIKTGG